MISSKHFLVLARPIAKKNPKNRSMFKPKYTRKVNTKKFLHQQNVMNQVLRLLKNRGEYSTPSPPRPRGRFNAVVGRNMANALHNYMVTSIKYHHQKAGSKTLNKRSTPAAYLFLDPKHNTRRLKGRSRSV
jgi:hypothetical protein